VIFRLKVFIPLVLLGVSAWFLRNHISTPLIEQKIEGLLPGLEIGDLEVDLQSESISIDGMAIYSDDEGPLASIAKLNFHLERSPLGFGEVVASGNIEDLRLSQRLFEMEEDHDERVSGNGTSSVVEEEESDFSFDSLDHREILERFTGERKLETEKRIEEGEELIKSIEEKWLPRQKALKQEIQAFKNNRKAWAKSWSSSLNIEPLLKEAKGLGLEAKKLKELKFSGKNVAELASNLQKIQSFQSQVTDLQGKFIKARSSAKNELSKLGPLGQALKNPPSIGKEVEADLKKILELRESLSSSAKNDVELLKKELDPRSFNSSKTVRLIMGREWETTFKSALDILDNTLGPFLPKLSEGGGEKMGEGSLARQEDSDVVGIPKQVIFERRSLRPAWTLGTLRYAGYATQAFENADIRFEGMLHDLSSDEGILGRAPRMSLVAYLPGRGGRVNIDLLYSLTSNTADQRRLNVHLEGRPLEGTRMGSSSSRLHFKSGHWGLDGVVDLSSAPHWVVRGEIFWKEPIFDLGPEVNEKVRVPLRAAATRLLAKPIAFQYQYPDELKFEGDFDRWLGPIFNEALVAMAGQEQAALASKIEARLGPKLNGLFKGGEVQNLLQGGMPLLLKGVQGEKQAFIQLQNLAGTHLKKLGDEEGVLGELVSQLIGLKGEGEGAKGRLEDTLKKEAQRRLRELATRQLKEKLLGGDLEKNGSPTSKKAEEVAKDPKEIIKDELKKEFKEVLRGFPF